MLKGRADELGQLAALAAAAPTFTPTDPRTRPTDEPEAVALAARAEAAAVDGRATDALRFGHGALALLERAGGHDALPQALIAIGVAHDVAGRARAARQVLRRARRVARRHGLADWELRAVDHQLALAVRAAPLSEAEEVVGEAIALAAGRGGRTYEARWRLSLARLRVRAGDLDGALLLAEEVLDGGRGSPELERPARALLAELHYERGDVEAGLTVLEPMLRRPEVPEGPQLEEALRASAALLAAASADHAATWQHTEQLTELAQRTPGACAPARVITDLAAGGADPDRLGHLWYRVRPRAHAGDAAWPAHVEGALAEATGDAEAAADAYERAVSADEGKRGRLHLAAAHVGLARTLRTVTHHDEAQDHAGRALRLLARAHGWRRDEARRLCARAVSRCGRATHGLSPREREVAALVATGLSNPEIADRLFIAPKTASAHVSHILTKLGFRSRTEVAAWAATEGLVALTGHGVLTVLAPAAPPAP